MMTTNEIANAKTIVESLFKEIANAASSDATPAFRLPEKFEARETPERENQDCGFQEADLHPRQRCTEQLITSSWPNFGSVRLSASMGPRGWVEAHPPQSVSRRRQIRRIERAHDGPELLIKRKRSADGVLPEVPGHKGFDFGCRPALSDTA